MIYAFTFPGLPGWIFEYGEDLKMSFSLQQDLLSNIMNQIGIPGEAGFPEEGEYGKVIVKYYRVKEREGGERKVFEFEVGSKVLILKSGEVQKLKEWLMKVEK